MLPKPVVLVCRTVDGRHELWGLYEVNFRSNDGIRAFRLIGTVTNPEDYKNRVVIS
jgi:hypothetical protein